MPSYPLTFPTLTPHRVRARRERAQGLVPNEFSLQDQVQLFPAQRWMISVEMQPMSRPQAAIFDTWLGELDGLTGTFSFNLDPWVPGRLPGAKTFRLLSPDDEFDSVLATNFGFNFSAFEVI